MGTLGNIGRFGNKNQNSTWQPQKKEKQENKVKSSILLSCIGPQGKEIYNTFTFSQERESFDYNDIVEKFEHFCIPRQNITLLRYKFLTYKQKESQRSDEFMTQLTKAIHSL